MKNENLEKQIIVTNLKERGFLLPIGIFDGKVLKRDFALRELGYLIEKAIGKFKKQNEGMPSTAVVSKVVSLLLSRLGGEDWNYTPDDSPDLEIESFIKLGKMWFADIYFIYAMARLEEIGPEYKIGFACQFCGFTGEMTCDLNSMEVSCVVDQSLLRRKVNLVKGIKYRDGSIKKSVFIQPMLWTNMVTNEVNEAGGDALLMKLHFIKHCVIGVDGIDDPIVLDESELATLRKIDIEKIANEINRINIGPSLTAKGLCPNEDCQAPFVWPIDWDYDNFFTISSQ